MQGGCDWCRELRGMASPLLAQMIKSFQLVVGGEIAMKLPSTGLNKCKQTTLWMPSLDKQTSGQTNCHSWHICLSMIVWVTCGEYNDTIAPSEIRRLKWHRNHQVHCHQIQMWERTAGVISPITEAVSFHLWAWASCCSYLNRHIIPWTISACNCCSGP